MRGAYYGKRLSADNYTDPENMLDPIPIRSGSGRKHWPEAGRMILAHRLASGPDPFGQKTLTQSVLHNVIRAVCGRTEPSPKVGNW